MSNHYMPDPEQYLQALEAPEQPQKKPRRTKRMIIATLVISVIIIFAYAVYLVSIISQASTRPFSLGSLATDQAGHTNVLVLGIGNPGHAGEKLSDSIMLVSINQVTHHAVYVSIPRDLRVRPEGYNYMKINQANAVGGSDLARTTVEDLLGVSIQYTVTTDFDGLKNLVDAVGGIDVNVKNTLADPEYPCSADERKSCGLMILAGNQHMNGDTALQYARCRKGNCGNDFGRAARQQEVIDLVVKKVAKPSIVFHPIEISRVAQAISRNMTTDMSGVNLAQFLKALQQSKSQTERFVLSTDSGGLLTGAYGSSDLVPVGGNYNRIQSKIAELLK